MYDDASLPPPVTSRCITPEKSGVSTPKLGDSIGFSGEGLSGGGNGLVSASLEQTAAESDEGTGGAEELPSEVAEGGAGANDVEWGADPSLGPGAPG